MIITIDGPAGSGKSSVARALANRLGFRFLDTGAMYRVVTLAAMECGVELEDADALETVARNINIQLSGDRVILDGRDATDPIRSADVTEKTRHAADNVGVRSRLVELQREAAHGGDVVTEGRDQGTVVFPDAPCKIFLTASEETRADRRRRDLLARGEDVTHAEVLVDQRRRDARDAARKVGALKKSPDAVEVNTDGMTLEEVVDRLEDIVQEKLGAT